MTTTTTTTSTGLSGRATAVLERFPAFLALVDPDKDFARVVDTFARELDRRSAEVSRIRRAHRLGEGETEWDLLALAALHDYRRSDFDLLTRRLSALRSAAASLLLEPGQPAAAEARASLGDLIGAPDDRFPIWSTEADGVAADQRLGNALTGLGRHGDELDHLRRRVTALAGVHQRGNGTPAALLTVAATHLGLAVEDIASGDDGYWHLAQCRDEFVLTEPSEPGTDPGVITPESSEVVPMADLLALEDNPFRTAEVDPVERRHGDRFLVTRSGWEEVPVTVRVVGRGQRTVRPMVINIDSGVGVSYTGIVDDGAELRFESVGVATVDGAVVTRSCYGFRGGVFAEKTAANGRDFVFGDRDDPAAHGDRVGSYAVAMPYADAFESFAVFPHAEGTLTAPKLRIGETRWGFFVGAGHFAGSGPPESPGHRLTAPRFTAGHWDQAVFESLGIEPSGAIGFSWQEREAFAARLWLPRRFEVLDEDGDITIAERIRSLLDRYRAAGVHLYVRYADERWILGTGQLRDLETVEGLGVVVAGTTLWADDAEQPDEP